MPPKKLRGNNRRKSTEKEDEEQQQEETNNGHHRLRKRRRLILVGGLVIAVIGMIHLTTNNTTRGPIVVMGTARMPPLRAPSPHVHQEANHKTNSIAEEEGNVTTIQTNNNHHQANNNNNKVPVVEEEETDSSSSSSAVPVLEELSNNNATSIIIISSLIPTHPSLDIINETIQSLRFLDGLPDDAPLIIAVDGLPENDSSEDNKKRLKAYIDNLHKAYVGHGQRRPVQIVGGTQHVHITGNIKQGTDVLTTKYMYVMQHDDPFCRPINHTAIVKTIIEYPHLLDFVRFNRWKNRPIKPLDRTPCFDQTPEPLKNINDISFVKTSGWTDNTHFTSKNYYEKIYRFFHSKFGGDLRFALKRATEGVLMDLGKNNCSEWGAYLYGPRGSGPYLCHKDGRATQPNQVWQDVANHKSLVFAVTNIHTWKNTDVILDVSNTTSLHTLYYNKLAASDAQVLYGDIRNFSNDTSMEIAKGTKIPIVVVRGGNKQFLRLSLTDLKNYTTNRLIQILPDSIYKDAAIPIDLTFETAIK